MRMKHVIYRLEFPDGQFYIGATSNFTSRRRKHLAALRGYEPATNKKLAHAFQSTRACGIYPIASALTSGDLLKLEAQVIALENPPLNGKLGVSVAAVCARYGVLQATFITRRKRGWNVLQSLGLRPAPHKEKPKVKQRKITVGSTTKTINQWATHIGVQPSAIHARLGSGWSEAQAVGQATPPQRKNAAQPKPPKREKTCYWINGVYGTLPEICRKFNFPISVASNRRRLQWPQEKWLDPVKERTQTDSAPLPENFLDELHAALAV